MITRDMEYGDLPDLDRSKKSAAIPFAKYRNRLERMGMTAFLRGVKLEDCPFGDEQDSPATSRDYQRSTFVRLWRSGWLEAAKASRNG